MLVDLDFPQFSEKIPCRWFHTNWNTVSWLIWENIGKLNILCVQYCIGYSSDYGRPKKFRTFELGQTHWSDKFWGIWDTVHAPLQPEVFMFSTLFFTAVYSVERLLLKTIYLQSIYWSKIFESGFRLSAVYVQWLSYHTA